MNIRNLIVLAGLLLGQAACASSSEEGLAKILAAKSPPAGVVFEIASGDDSGLDWALPLVQSYSRQLRQRFPGIKLAVVSHGDEQFQLTETNRQRFANTHQQVASLVKDQGIPVHVCGNYAAENGVDEDEFIGLVDVASRGPARVDAYEDAGYEVLFIQKPKKGTD